jgi:hypothetical protein
MFESLVTTSAVGFAVTYIALEAAWHFTACRIKDKSIKPCLFKQIGLLK